MAASSCPEAASTRHLLDADARAAFAVAPSHGCPSELSEIMQGISEEAFRAVLTPSFSTTTAHLGRLLVTGASGFIGGHIARHARPVARFELGRVAELLRPGDVLVHCGAVVNHVATCEELLSANVLLPLELQAVCRKAGAKFVQISTTEVNPARHVSSPAELIAALGSGYARSKALAELALARDPDVLVIRLGHVGPGNDNDLAEMILAEAVARNAAPSTTGTIHTMDVEAVAHAIVACARGGYRGIIQLEQPTPLRWQNWFRRRGVSGIAELDAWLEQIANPRLLAFRSALRAYLERDRCAPVIAPPEIADIIEGRGHVELVGSEDATSFPAPDTAATDGLIALGGSVSKRRLLAAYERGIFRWHSAHEAVMWWCPDLRFVLLPEKLHVSRELAQVLRRGPFRITFDACFERVIDECRTPQAGHDGTWISEDAAAVYCDLHRNGHAHSVEAWVDDELVGGTYGVVMGGVWFGESNFSRVCNASRAVSVFLAKRLIGLGFEMIDCQIHSEHMKAMGAEMLPRPVFLQKLAHAIRKPMPGVIWPATYHGSSIPALSGPEQIANSSTRA
jgi:leucyl/phenylalanyl-tRNA--protein transferase